MKLLILTALFFSFTVVAQTNDDGAVNIADAIQSNTNDAKKRSRAKRLKLFKNTEFTKPHPMGKMKAINLKITKKIQSLRRLIKVGKISESKIEETREEIANFRRKRFESQRRIFKTHKTAINNRWGGNSRK
ncbi:MAG: hypothetical protein HN576_02800 [Bacteriovoracaceae bacterium]|mgnify:CR=1 FL=1|jgi:hypothetical protein|nr:hypothetical protein [Bacteriovoracaceae bacterium]